MPIKDLFQIRTLPNRALARISKEATIALRPVRAPGANPRKIRICPSWGDILSNGFFCMSCMITCVHRYTFAHTPHAAEEAELLRRFHAAVMSVLGDTPPAKPIAEYGRIFAARCSHPRFGYTFPNPQGRNHQLVAEDVLQLLFFNVNSQFSERWI